MTQDRDRDAGQEMVHELGIDPAADVDDRQRFELLREWHTQDAEREAEEKAKKEQRKKRH